MTRPRIYKRFFCRKGPAPVPAQKQAGELIVVPLQQKSRLQTMAGKNALICIPEGTEELRAGTLIEVQLLDTRVLREE